MKVRDVPQTGSLGESVSYKNRYGLIRRRKITPRDPRTPVQVDRRSSFQRARAFWGTLTDEQFLAWNTVASTRRTRAVLGQSAPLSGYELSIHINTHLAMLNLPMASDPTPAPPFPANPIVGLIATNIHGAFSLKLQVSGTPVQYGARLRRQAPRPRRFLCGPLRLPRRAASPGRRGLRHHRPLRCEVRRAARRQTHLHPNHPAD